MRNLFEQWPLFKPNTPGNSNYFPDNLSITDMVFWFDNNAKKLLDVIKKTKNHEQKQMFIQHLTSTLYNNNFFISTIHTNTSLIFLSGNPYKRLHQYHPHIKTDT